MEVMNVQPHESHGSAVPSKKKRVNLVETHCPLGVTLSLPDLGIYGFGETKEIAENLLEVAYWAKYGKPIEVDRPIIPDSEKEQADDDESKKLKNPELHRETKIAIGEIKSDPWRRRKAVEYVEAWMKVNEPWAIPYLHQSQLEQWRFE